MDSSSGPPSRSPTARRRLLLTVVLIVGLAVAGVAMVLAVQGRDQDDCLDAGGRWTGETCEGARPGG